MALTNDAVERALAAPKRITEACVWRPRKGRKGLEMRVGVGFYSAERTQWELGEFFAMAVLGRKISAALLYFHQPIRRLDHGNHANPDKIMVTGIHKHRWDEVDNQRWAYKPQEFQDDDLIHHPDEVVRLFLAECAIELKGEYQPFLLG